MAATSVMSLIIALLDKDPAWNPCTLHVIIGQVCMLEGFDKGTDELYPCQICYGQNEHTCHFGTGTTYKHKCMHTYIFMNIVVQ